MEEQRKVESERREEESKETQDKPPTETEQRPKDLAPKDAGKDVKGGAFRASERRLKQGILPA